MAHAVSKKWVLIIMALVLVLAVTPLLTACGGDDDEEETKTVQPTKTGEPTTTVQPTETEEPTGTVDECTKEETFRVGTHSTIMGMSAEARDFSPELAMNEINEAGGIIIGDTCIKFKYNHEDDGGTAAGAVAAVQKQLREFKADVIWNTGSIPPAPVWRPYAEAEKVICFATFGPVGDWIGEEYPYTFHFHYNDEPDVLLLLDWISKNRPDIKKVHGVRQLATTYEAQMEVVGDAALPEYGIEYTGTEWHDVQTRDFYPVLTAALKHDPDAIICDAYSVSLFAKQARELGFEGTFIVPAAIPDYAFSMMKPEEINGIISLTASVESPLVPQYYKDYKESYKEWKGGYPYSTIVFSPYMGMYYLAAAIKAAGSTDSDKLKEAMETQTLTLEFPSGETVDVKMGGAEFYGINHAWSPPKYLSVIQNKKPEVLEVITSEKTDPYMRTIMKYK